MTDEPDLKQLSGFRTPLAAAMLSGVLAAAVDIIVWHVIFWHGGSSGGVWAFRFFRNGVLIPRFAFLCSGPAISRRSWKLAAWAWLWAFGFIVLENTWTYVPVLLGSVGLNFSGFLTRMMIFSLWGQTANIGLSGALLGFALTRLYGFRPYSKWAPLLGAIGGIAVFLVVHQYCSARNVLAA